MEAGIALAFPGNFKVIKHLRLKVWFSPSDAAPNWIRYYRRLPFPVSSARVIMIAAVWQVHNDKPAVITNTARTLDGHLHQTPGSGGIDAAPDAQNIRS